MATSVELREERATLIAEARKTYTDAEKREGGITAADEEDFEKAMDGAEKLEKRYKQLERLEAAERGLDEPGERRSASLDGSTRERETSIVKHSDTAVSADFRHWMITGEVRKAVQPDPRRVAELRDTIVGTDAKGGYLLAPVKLTSDIVKLVDDQVFMRNLATITKVTDAKKLGIRKLLTRMADANWTTEVGAVTEDATMAFDRRDLEPYLLTKLAKASLRTLMLVTDAESIIRDELAYKFAITQEKAFMTGDGSSKPLGVFTASASGISTGRDVTAATGHTTTFDADDLMNIKYSLKSAYMNDPTVRWVFHRDAIKIARKLKDSYGVYLWSPGLSGGQPDKILDTPFVMSEYAPNTFTLGLYYCMIGAFRYYRIAEVADLMIQRLTELYAATNEIGFIGRIWVDGAPILEEAFARGKLAAS